MTQTCNQPSDQKKNICLLGQRDTGKTTILNKLAKKLNDALYDSQALTDIKYFNIERFMINSLGDYLYIFNISTKCKSYKILINTAGDVKGNFDNFSHNFYENRNYDLLFFCQRIACDDEFGEYEKGGELLISKNLDDSRFEICDSNLFNYSTVDFCRTYKKNGSETIEKEGSRIVDELFKKIEDLCNA